MSSLFRLLTWLSLWVAGCRLFADLLLLEGPWLMASGVLTFLVASAVVGELFD